MTSNTLDELVFHPQTKSYITHVLDPILMQMMEAVLDTGPEDPVDFVIQWLRTKGGVKRPSRKSVKEMNASLKNQVKIAEEFRLDMKEMNKQLRAASKGSSIQESKQSSEAQSSEEESEEEEEEEEQAMIQAMQAKQRGQRQSVSAEAYGQWNKAVEFTAPVHPKSTEQKDLLRKILCRSFLFSALVGADMDIVVDAVKESEFPAGSHIITEGDDGDCLYVIEEGSPVCKKLIDGEQKVVKTCEPGDVFGELALLYNCPRAASVEAPERCMCWSLDRLTFNTIVREAATKRSLQYDKFLKTVSLLNTITMFERSQIVDSLIIDTFKKGDYIFKQGDPPCRFYLLEEGSLAAMKRFKEGEEPRKVFEYKSPGEYFGELGLLRNQPRAASIRVTSAAAKVVSLSKAHFGNLVPKLMDALTKRAESYE